MITKQEWWNMMSAYHTLISPWQYIMLAIASMLVLFVVIKPGKTSSMLMKGYFVLAFTWIGIGFYMELIPGGAIFSPLFMVIALFFGIDIYKQRLIFVVPENKGQRYLTLAFFVLILSYPLVGLLYGHNSTEIFMVGTLPCPTTSLALIMLTIALPKVYKTLYELLLFWSVMAIPAILMSNAYEDFILLASGIYALSMLVKNWRN